VLNLRKTAVALAAVLAIGGVGALLCSCETESANNADIIISPASVTLGQGEQVELTASGWSDYRWSLSDEHMGALSRRTGETTVYTAVSSGGSNSVQTVTATGLGYGGNNTTNYTDLVVSGTAIIRHNF
jgi:hypothetical protein